MNNVHSATCQRWTFNAIAGSPCIVSHFLFEGAFENGVFNICTLESVIHHFLFSM